MKQIRVRNLVLGDGIPKICVPVIAHTYSELEHSLGEIRKSSFDLVEFRADFYFEEEEPALEAVRSAAGDRPVLYTIRTNEEGGEISIDDDLYRERNLAAARFADLVDVQLGRISRRAGDRVIHSDLVKQLHAAGAGVVLSWHDFERTPDREQLARKMRRMHKEGCDIAKVAVMPRNRADVMELLAASLEMLEEEDMCPFISMSMGNLGKVTRAAGSFSGSCISFGMAGESSAPGQIRADLLRGILAVLDIPAAGPV